MTSGTTTDRLLLAGIAENIKRVHEYVEGDRRRFLGSTMVQDAVLRNLQTLAESTQRLSDQVKATEPNVPWRQIAGFRNVLAHGYLSIDLDVVWNTVEQDLPGLSVAIDRMARNAQGADPALSDQRENESVSGEHSTGEPTSTPDPER